MGRLMRRPVTRRNTGSRRSKKTTRRPARSTGSPGWPLPPLIFSARGVFPSADRVLHLAGDLLGLALRFGLGVARYLSDLLLHGSLHLVSRAFHAIFDHCCLSFPVAGGQLHGTGFVPRVCVPAAAEQFIG